MYREYVNVEELLLSTGSIPGVGGGGDFSSFRVQTGLGVHSASNKMSTGVFPWG